MKKGYLVKFGDEDHLVSLQKGELYFNTVDYFKKVDAKTPGRFDKQENINIFMPKAKINVYPSHAKMQNSIYSDIVYDVGINTGKSNIFTHIWCCYAVIIDELDIGGNIFPPEMYNEFSDYMLIIHKVDAFYARIKQACIKHQIDIEGRLVEYRDNLQYQENMNVFTKLNIYEKQNEYRFAIKQINLEPCSLEIGSIADISVLTHKEQIANKVELQNRTLVLK